MSNVALVLLGNLMVAVFAIGSSALIVRALVIHDRRLEHPPRVIAFPHRMQRWRRRHHHRSPRFRTNRLGVGGSGWLTRRLHKPR